jgi:predicted outer membrane repeat protein
MLKRSLLAAISSVMLTALLVATPAPARAGSTIYVGPGGGSGGCASPDYETNGSSDNLEIFEAAAFAANLDTIYLCAGTYHFSAQVDLGEAADGKSLTFQGAGRTRTILDATGANSRFFIASNVTLTFRDLTMRNAHTDSFAGAVWGEHTTNIIIERSAFIDNYADSGMGAIFAREGTVSVTSSLFDGNHSDSFGDVWGGGAINADGDNAVVYIANSVFTGNYSVRPGGAIKVNGPLVITNSTFNNNESEEDGGAISAYDDLRMTASSFTENITHSEGASVFVECDEFVDVSTSKFVGNHAVGYGSDGGAFNIECINSEVDISFDRNTFSRNTADDVGGAIDEDSGNLMVFSNNKFLRNSSKSQGSFPDGAGAIWASYIQLSRNTFTGNTSLACGGAIFVAGSDYGTSRGHGNRFSGNRGRGSSRYADVCFGNY